MNIVKTHIQSLNTALQANPMPDCAAELVQLKIELTKLGQSKEALELARNALEVAVLISVKKKDDSAFERYMAQLRPYYFDYGLPSSDSQSRIIGLYLVYLLTKSKLSDFHVELELIPHLRNDPFVNFSIQIEQDMTEGRYNRVWQSCRTIPHESFAHFASTLTDAARTEIATCIEAAYDSLKVQDAMKLLHFAPNETEAFKSFASKDGRSWPIENGVISFKVEVPVLSPEAGAETLIGQSLTYAAEIERII